MTRVPMTSAGAARLRQELDHLKGVARRNVVKAIAEAREHGDLRENAEYHAAKEQQSFIEGRIADLEHKLSHAHIVDSTEVNAGGKVVFAATVELLNLDTDEPVTFQIVGDDEADLKDGKVSVSSPIARALIGKETGDVVSVETPKGSQEYEIQDVRYV